MDLNTGSETDTASEQDYHDPDESNPVLEDDNCPDLNDQSNINQDEDPDDEVTATSYDDFELKAALERSQKVTGQTVTEPNLEEYDLSPHKFDNSWEAIIDTYLPKKLKTETFLKARQWIELVVDPIRKFLSSIRCRLCFYHLEEFSITSRHKTDLSRQQGVMRGSRSQNDRVIHDHPSKKTHQAVVHALKQKQIDELNDVKYKELRHHRITCHNFRNVYFGIMAGMSFNSHTLLTTLEEMNGIKLGHLCRSKQTAQKIASFISTTMHQELLDYLNIYQPWLSIIADGSTGDYSRIANFCTSTIFAIWGLKIMYIKTLLI